MQDGKPDKQLYTLTEEGTAVFQNWLNQTELTPPVRKHPLLIPHHSLGKLLVLFDIHRVWETPSSTRYFGPRRCADGPLPIYCLQRKRIRHQWPERRKSRKQGKLGSWPAIHGNRAAVRCSAGAPPCDTSPLASQLRFVGQFNFARGSTSPV